MIIRGWHYVPDREKRKYPTIVLAQIHISHLDQVTIGELLGRVRGGSEILLSFDMRCASREFGIIGQPESFSACTPALAAPHGWCNCWAAAELSGLH